jgi:hypothetical protein
LKSIRKDNKNYCKQNLRLYVYKPVYYIHIFKFNYLKRYFDTSFGKSPTTK